MNTSVVSDEWNDIREHLLKCLNISNSTPKTKEAIRSLHEIQRMERAKNEENLLRRYGHKLLSYFAEGTEIDPSKINPQLIAVTKPNSIEGLLFRVATLLWSIPVSRGYGRRMRYLVIDRQNSKLIGLFGLGDPVFNLKCRDDWIGWNIKQRLERLAFMLDAYVLGAVPPYSLILGGKLVGSLLAAHEIRVNFRNRYANTQGLISKRIKDPHLVLITTTSALGRSSIYNRLKLPNIVNLLRIGTTDGWGHFLITDELFKQVRSVLRAHGDPYSDNYKFGQGPSWRFRAIRKACLLLKIDDNLLHHGIRREVYAIPLVTNWREILLGEQQIPESSLVIHDASEIGKAAVNRWVIPRTDKNNDWLRWTRSNTWDALTKYAFQENE